MTAKQEIPTDHLFHHLEGTFDAVFVRQRKREYRQYSTCLLGHWTPRRGAKPLFRFATQQKDCAKCKDDVETPQTPQFFSLRRIFAELPFSKARSLASKWAKLVLIQDEEEDLCK